MGGSERRIDLGAHAATLVFWTWDIARDEIWAARRHTFRIGLANGILVTIVGIDSFIATLGTGTLLYGFNEWYTGAGKRLPGFPKVSSISPEQCVLLLSICPLAGTRRFI